MAACQGEGGRQPGRELRHALTCPPLTECPLQPPGPHRLGVRAWVGEVPYCVLSSRGFCFSPVHGRVLS